MKEISDRRLDEIGEEFFAEAERGQAREEDRGCGGKFYRQGCGCIDCTDRGDWERHRKQDREMESEP